MDTAKQRTQNFRDAQYTLALEASKPMPAPTTTYSGLPLPHGWHCVQPWGDGLVWERVLGQRLVVMEDITVKADGRKWLHVSVSTPNLKLPTYEDVQTARKAFIGEHRECYQVYPPKERYVNVGNILHLWCCMEQPEGVLPHFEGIVNGELTI